MSDKNTFFDILTCAIVVLCGLVHIVQCSVESEVSTTTIRNDIDSKFNKSEQQHVYIIPPDLGPRADIWWGNSKNWTITLQTHNTTMEVLFLAFSASNYGNYKLAVELDPLDSTEPTVSRFEYSGTNLDLNEWENISTSGLVLKPNTRYSVVFSSSRDFNVRLFKSATYESRIEKVKFEPFTLELPFFAVDKTKTEYFGGYGSPLLGVWYKTLTPK